MLQNVVTRETDEMIDLPTVDAPESPDFSPDGRHVVFSALRNAVGDIYLVDLETEEVTNLTEDEFADYAPTFSPDGSYVVYVARISGNNKLFKLDLATREKTQLTFGTFSEASAQFLDENTLVFASTATDPLAPVDPDVAANADIYNVWTLDLNNGELRQYTDTATGNVSTIVLPGDPQSRIAFVTYFKGEYGIHTIERNEPLYTASTSDFGAPGPNIDFQAPLTHTLVTANNRRKGRFEKMFLDGTPPINVGMTNSGDFLGGTAVSFSDVLGDQSFSLMAYSIAQYRTFSGSYFNVSGRFQYALQDSRRRCSSMARPVSTPRRSPSSAVTRRSRCKRYGGEAPSASIRSTATAASSSPAGCSISTSGSTIRFSSSNPTATNSSIRHQAVPQRLADTAGGVVHPGDHRLP